MITAASVGHSTQSPLQHPLSLLHMQIVMQLPRLPALSRHMLCKRYRCICDSHVCCRRNIGEEECVCGFVQPQQAPDLGPPSATPPQLYLHQEHSHSEFPAQAVNQSKLYNKVRTLKASPFISSESHLIHQCCTDQWNVCERQ